ncbi:hypothetical protein Osc7112_1807 [Oscillatoria nigro-viridis PCC 7112]|uniref:Uncharacterized protein n=1 Tax=Phormidium nigroviride PCC 7112 TaxID=179408 RepID=K9VFN2_9CYAN|nr:hypothetical protein Osc7112_1807 [Oscillatoria nigro-viridis PCC 7112]
MNPALARAAQMPGKLSSSAPVASRFEIRDFRLTPQINLGGLNFCLKFLGLHDCCEGFYPYLGAVRGSEKSFPTNNLWILPKKLIFTLNLKSQIYNLQLIDGGN